jgi:hypothetical protein
MTANPTRGLSNFAFIIAVLVGTMLGSRNAAAVDPLNPSPGCSVFDPGPCTPSFCGVFSGSPCVPNILPPIGQDLHLTIASLNADHALERCAPMPLSKGMAGAIAGRPIAIRFIDDRND